MGVASTKAAKHSHKASSLQELETQVEYVNSVIEAICRCKNGQYFILVCTPLVEADSARFEANIFIYKVKYDGEPWVEKHKVLRTTTELPFARLGLSQFARFYDRVQLLAPLDTSKHGRTDITSSGTVKPPSDSSEDSECMICMEKSVEVVLPDCNHAFCKKCLDEWTAVSKTCPMCRSHTESNDTVWIMAENPTADQLFTSLSELLEKLRSDPSASSNS